MSVTFPFQTGAGSEDQRPPGTMYRDENDDIWVVLADSSVVQVGAGGGSQPNVTDGTTTIDAPALIEILGAVLSGDATEAVFTLPGQPFTLTFPAGIGGDGSNPTVVDGLAIWQDAANDSILFVGDADVGGDTDTFLFCGLTDGSGNAYFGLVVSTKGENLPKLYPINYGSAGTLTLPAGLAATDYNLGGNGTIDGVTVSMPNLPSSPGATGQLYSNAGIVTVSP